MRNWFRLDEGTRDFLREIAIVVIGVLVALMVNEIAELFHWHERVAGAQARISSEMQHDRTAIVDRIGWQRCTGQALDQLDAVLKGAERDGRLPDIEVIPAPGFQPLSSATWSTAIVTGVVAHMPEDDAERYARYYAAIDRLAEGEWTLAQQWTTIDDAIHNPGPIGSEKVEALRTSLAQIRTRMRSNGFGMHQALAEANPAAPGTKPPAAEGGCRPLMVDRRPYSERPAT